MLASALFTLFGGLAFLSLADVFDGKDDPDDETDEDAVEEDQRDRDLQGTDGTDDLTVEPGFERDDAPDPSIVELGEGADRLTIDPEAFEGVAGGSTNAEIVVTDFDPMEDSLVLTGLLGDEAGGDADIPISDLSIDVAEGETGPETVLRALYRDGPEGTDRSEAALLTVRLEGVVDLDPEDLRIGIEQSDGSVQEVNLIEGGDGDDTADGPGLHRLGDGNDTLSLGSNDGIGLTGDGDDRVQIDGGGNFVDTGDGDDVIDVRGDPADGPTIVRTGEGADVVRVSGDGVTVYADGPSDIETARDSGPDIFIDSGGDFFSNGQPSGDTGAQISVTVGQEVFLAGGPDSSLTLRVYPEHVGRGPAILNEDGNTDIVIRVPPELEDQVVLDTPEFSEVTFVRLADGTDLATVTRLTASDPPEDGGITVVADPDLSGAPAT